MDNKRIRRSIRKYIKHYGTQDTRRVITTFACAYNTPKQRIAGNLKTMAYDEKTIHITIHIPYCYSTMK